MIRFWPVQQAVYTLLALDPTFMGMVTAFVDQPSQNQAVPYVTIGPGTGVPADCLVETGSSQTLQLDFWDRDAPMSRLKQIMDRAIFVVHGKHPQIVGWSKAVRCDAEYAEVIQDVDTLHGVLRVRVDTFL